MSSLWHAWWYNEQTIGVNVCAWDLHRSLPLFLCMGRLAKANLEWLPDLVIPKSLHIERLDGLYLGHLKIDEYEPAADLLGRAQL